MHFVQGSKYHTETISIVQDFADMMSAGDSITGVPVITISVASGSDPIPQDMLYQGVSVIGKMVEQRFRFGVEGVIYSILFTVQTAQGFTLEKDCYLAILPEDGAAIPNWLSLYETSSVYPMYTQDRYQAKHILTSGRLITTRYPIPPEATQAKHILTSGTIVTFGTPKYTIPHEDITARHILVSGDIEIFGAIKYNIPNEATTTRHILISGTLIGVGISYDIPFEATITNHILTGGTLS